MMTGGWKKDTYDARDYLYKAICPKVPYPQLINLSHLLPRDAARKVLVRNQKFVGACTGHAKGFALCAEATQLGIWPEQDYEWFSPTWIYNGARFIEGTLPYDLGAYPRDCCDWLVANGTLLEHFWPYDGTKLDKTAPGTTRMAQAVKYKDFAYWRVTDGVDGILGALNDGHVISIGAPWFEKWSDSEVASTGVLPEVSPSDSVGGGHDTGIFLADQAARVFIGLNSWGPEWGGSFDVPGCAGGLYALPFSAIEAYKAAGGYDAYVITFEKDPVGPGPEPGPQPEPNNPGCLLGSFGNIFKRSR
jgi:hypothetical protein